MATRLGGSGIGVAVEQEQSCRLVADGKAACAVGQGSVASQTLVVQRREHRVERMLNRPKVSAGRAGADGAALDERDPRAAIGEDGCRRAADDSSADDHDLASHSPNIATRICRIPRQAARTAPTERLTAISGMATHRVRIADWSGLDAELIGWLREAYDRA